MSDPGKQIKGRTRSAIAATRDDGAWSYAGWCQDCYVRAVEPGQPICAACHPWARMDDFAMWEQEQEI